MFACLFWSDAANPAISLSNGRIPSAIPAPAEPVEQRDDERDEQDTEDDAECIEHHSSPMSHSATATNPNHVATPVAMSHHEGDCRATIWLKTNATATRFASARSVSPSAVRCRPVNRTIVAIEVVRAACRHGFARHSAEGVDDRCNSCHVRHAQTLQFLKLSIMAADR